MINRKDALNLLKEHLKNTNLVNHCIAVGAIMEKIAERLGEDTEKWFITGLLHDIDYEYTSENPDQHGLEAEKILTEAKIGQDIIAAVKAHTGRIKRTNPLEEWIYTADPVSGLIVAAVLVHPSKKVENLKLKSLKKRFKAKRFAAGADRDQIRNCENLDLPLSDFLKLSIEAMQNYSNQIGL